MSDLFSENDRFYLDVPFHCKDDAKALGAKWDSAVWDVDVWGEGLVATNTWLGITGIGYCGGLQLQTSSIGDQIQWASTDIVFQLGWAGV